MARKASVRQEDGPRTEASPQDARSGSRTDLGLELASSKVGRIADPEPPDSKVEPFDAEASKAFYERWLDEKKSKGKKLRRQAQAMFKAMDMWPIHSNSEEEWVNLCETTWNEYHSGRFFLEQLGAERFLQPKLFATLWMLERAAGHCCSVTVQMAKRRSRNTSISLISERPWATFSACS